MLPKRIGEHARDKNRNACGAKRRLYGDSGFGLRLRRGSVKTETIGDRSATFFSNGLLDSHSEFVSLIVLEIKP